MARPKEKTSLAFMQKTVAAADKLRKFQAQKLQTDLERMYTEEVLPDLTVELQGMSLSLHACVIRARSRSLYEYLMNLSTGGPSDATVSLLRYGRPSDIAAIFKALYTEEDVTEQLKKLEEILTETAHDTGQDSHNDRVSDSHDNESNGTIKNGLVRHDQQFYEIAEKIVEKSISDAKIVLQNDSVQNQNGIHETENVINLNGFANTEDDDNVINGTTEDLEVDITSTDKLVIEDLEGDSEDIPNVCNASQTAMTSQSESSGSHGGGGMFRCAREESSCTLLVLLERVYGSGDVFEPCCRLGEDLLRLYLEDLGTNQEFLVEDQTFKGHCCLLAARSSYFEAMFGGGWQESGSEQVLLEGMSPNVMKQMLLYLYGGVVELDPGCSIGSLMMMSDMYGMEGLKDVVAYNLNKEYCHFFHRPCPGCTVGVPDTLALTLMYNMEGLKEKCLKWINKNFGRVWPTKTFAALPPEVLESCVSSVIKDLTVDNVIDTLIECFKLNKTVPRVRWSEPVFDLMYQLMEAAIEYASQNFVTLVSSKAFRKLNQQGIAFNRQPLEDIFGLMIQALSPGNACQSYLSLDKWVVTVKTQEENSEMPLYSREFLEFVEHLYKKCREHLCTYIHQAANTAEWDLLTMSTQKDLMAEANYVRIDEPKKNRMAHPKLTSMQNRISPTPISVREYFNCHFGSKESLPTFKPPPSKNPPTKIPKGRSPTPTKADSSIASQLKSGTISASSSVMRKSGSTVKKQTSDRPALKTALGPTQVKTKLGQKVASKEREQSKGQSGACVKTNQRNLPKTATAETSAKSKSMRPSSSKNPSEGTVHEGTPSINQEECTDSLAQEIEDDDAGDQLVDDDEPVQPRVRSSSAGVVTFVPRFGQQQNAMKSAQSMDSFFDFRQGQNFSVQRPLPTLTVNFIVPHEFFENF